MSGGRVQAPIGIGSARCCSLPGAPGGSVGCSGCPSQATPANSRVIHIVPIANEDAVGRIGGPEGGKRGSDQPEAAGAARQQPEAAAAVAVAAAVAGTAAAVVAGEADGRLGTSRRFGTFALSDGCGRRLRGNALGMQGDKGAAATSTSPILTLQCVLFLWRLLSRLLHILVQRPVAQLRE
ncbi:hypothetical protein COO60DRAFT_1637264 [Scenedesmus sp. NREL 46B-D3]|nr:hypothetical protein COO60DRAFT_1637264 [Scenedesmus sp. NREL 46B-D3]